MIFFAQPVLAYCYEPSEPSCLSSIIDITEDEWTFNSCKRDVEHYTKEMIEYARCKSNAAIDKFNCLAKGEHFCY